MPKRSERGASSGNPRRASGPHLFLMQRFKGFAAPCIQAERRRGGQSSLLHSRAAPSMQPANLSNAWALRESRRGGTRLALWCALLAGFLTFLPEPLAQTAPLGVAAQPEPLATQEPPRVPAGDTQLQAESPRSIAGHAATAAGNPPARPQAADPTAASDGKAGPQRSWRRIVRKDGTEVVGWVRWVVPGEPVTVESEPDQSTVIPWDDIQHIAAAPTPPLLLHPQVAAIGTLDTFRAGILLNDGTLVRGTVTSYLPGQSVTVRTPVGNSTVIAWGMIARIQRLSSVPLAPTPAASGSTPATRSSGLPPAAIFGIIFGGVALTVGAVVGVVAGIDYISKHPPAFALFPSVPSGV